MHCALFQGEPNHNLGLHRLLCKTTTKTWNCKRQTNGSVIDSTTHTSPHTHTNTYTEKERRRQHMLLFMRSRANNPLLFCYHSRAPSPNALNHPSVPATPCSLPPPSSLLPLSPLKQLSAFAFAFAFAFLHLIST